jgi:phenylalanyl-tRNA synthetase beta chain
MKISLGWLSDYVALPASLPDLESVLTSAGLTVEGVEERGADFPHMVVARILESNPHPNADRLSVCRVEDGTPVPRQIVCGAKNFRVGDKVPLALPGALLPGDFKIKVGKLRGVESEGMLCSAKELRLADDAEGLLILPADAEVGSRISEIFPPDTILELEVTPNRPDWLCHIGVAREIAAFTGMPLRVPVIEIPATCPSEHIAIQDAGGCAFYSLVRVSGVRVGPSPAWLRQRLEGVGLRSINNVVDITNLVLMETGQPLHAFDAAKVEGPICVRPALHGETIEALDGVTYSLHGGELLIADARSPLALAGIMGGAASGVGETTSDVLLESALFHPSHIRRTARALGLSSDSSYRFERGVDPQGVLPASARALALLQSLANGTPEEAIRIAGALPTASQAIPFRPQRCRDLLGAAFTDEEMFGALKCFGLRQEGEGWVPPSFRLDLAREADLIEEVARRIGMERIPSRIAAAPAPASPADHRQDRLAKMRHSLAELGFFEARSGTLVPARPEAILLRNPMGEEQAALRPSLLPGLLDALQRNLHAGERLIRLFEAGKIYCTSEPEERLCVALAASGPIHEPHWRVPGCARLMCST